MQRYYQTTLRDSITFLGRGVHTNAPARLTLSPALAGSGITFIPSSSKERIAAHWSNVSATHLCTILENKGLLEPPQEQSLGSLKEIEAYGSRLQESAITLSRTGALVATVEHLMAALYGLQIDNVKIEIEGPEIPIMDGSAQAFVAAMDGVGVATLDLPRKYLRILKPIVVQHGASYGELHPCSGSIHSGLHVDVEIDFSEQIIGQQRWRGEISPEIFRHHLAPARTFGFFRDAEKLHKQGFASGASLENTLVFSEEGVMNPGGVRFPEECVRHKALDAIGDLALAGGFLLGRYKAYRPSHALNVALVSALWADESAFEILPVSSVQIDRSPELRPSEAYWPIPSPPSVFSM